VGFSPPHVLANFAGCDLNSFKAADRAAPP